MSIRGLRLTNGHRNVDGLGGAIYTEHSLALDSMAIENSKARGGGGVAFVIQYPGQLLSISNAQILGNVATDLFATTSPNAAGGGLYLVERCLGPVGTITDVPTITPVGVDIENSEFTANASQPIAIDGVGGAIRSWSLADIVIADTIIFANHVDAPNPPVVGKVYYGGGFEGTAKSLRIERSEIAANIADDITFSDATRSGGLHLDNGLVTRQGQSDVMGVRIVNSTISANVSAATAGAMVAFGNLALELDNTTVNGNSAAPTRTGGIVMSSGATYPVSASNTAPPSLKLVSSILANNSSNGGDVATNTATIPTFGINAFNSLVQNPCSTCAIVVSGPATFVGTDPLVGPLAFNGGTTRTHALLPGSPALNSGSNDLALTTDQRGFGFPRVAGGAPDMGAYEASQSLAISGGTFVDLKLGLIGTSFLFDPTTAAGTLSSAVTTGPASWNAGSSHTCFLYQPPRTAPERSICWLFALPITGSYTAQGSVGSSVFTGAVSVDAANQLAALQITSVTTGAGSVSVAWTPPPNAHSFLVRVNPVPFTGGITGEMIFSRGTSAATLTGLALSTGATYQLSVYAFSQDVETPDLLTSVFNVSDDNTTFIAP